MVELHGTYRGFAPTDESPIAMGELEVVIDSSGIRIRHATGLMINSDEIPSKIIRPLTRDEVAPQFIAGSKAPDQVLGFKVGEEGVTLLFMPITEESEELGLVVRGNEMADFLGPTIAFGPQLIKEGFWQKTLDSMKESGDFWPMLEHDGKMPPEYYEKR